MKEETFMSQENKKVSVHLEKIDSNDYMIFDFEPIIKVCLTDEVGQADLKKLFSTLLTQIISEPLLIEYVENPDYKTGLYIDVCKEYLKDLNREITDVRSRIPEKLKKIKLSHGSK